MLILDLSRMPSIAARKLGLFLLIPLFVGAGCSGSSMSTPTATGTTRDTDSTVVACIPEGVAVGESGVCCDGLVPFAADHAMTVCTKKEEAEKLSDKIMGGAQGPIALDYEWRHFNAATSTSPDRLIVLFFATSTCTSCDQEWQTIQSIFSRPPEEATYLGMNVVAFRVNAGDDASAEEKALAAKYKAAAHTKAIIYKNQLLWTSSRVWTEQDYLNEIAKRLKK